MEYMIMRGHLLHTTIEKQAYTCELTTKVINGNLMPREATQLGAMTNRNNSILYKIQTAAYR